MDKEAQEKLPNCPRFEYHDIDKCETVCDFDLMLKNCPLLIEGYRKLPKDKPLTQKGGIMSYITDCMASMDRIRAGRIRRARIYLIKKKLKRFLRAIFT